MPKPIETGVDAIREALKNRARKMNTAGMARDLGLPSNTLDAFMRGDSPLSPETLKALAVDLFHGHGEFVPELNKLRSVNKAEPISQGSGPPRFDPATSPYAYKAGPHPVTCQPVKAVKPVPKVPRLGWVE